MNGKKIMLRLTQLRAASTLAELMKLRQGRCHFLVGDRKGQLAVDLEAPKRLVFEPAHDVVPRKENGGVDTDRVTRVRITEIVDYHG